MILAIKFLIGLHLRYPNCNFGPIRPVHQTIGGGDLNECC